MPLLYFSFTLDIVKIVTNKESGEVFMKITICIGSSCHLKGSRQVVEQLQNLIGEKCLQVKTELCGSFCMNNCLGEGVCIKIGEKVYLLQPENTKAFFEKEILAKLEE